MENSSKDRAIQDIVRAVIESADRNAERAFEIHDTEGDGQDGLRSSVAKGEASFVENREDHVLVSIDKWYPGKDPGKPDPGMVELVEALKRTQFFGESDYGRDISWGMFGFLTSFHRIMPSCGSTELREELVKATKLGLLTFCICENSIGRDFIEIHFKK
jgi:hypothetical protein